MKRYQFFREQLRHLSLAPPGDELNKMLLVLIAEILLEALTPKVDS